jgi:hypothetical protein
MAIAGTGVVGVRQRIVNPRIVSSGLQSDALRAAIIEWQIRKSRSGLFGQSGRAVYFSLWYPALIFAIAAVATLRIGRFTLRSAIIATTVACVLLGLAVAL